jgi:hypothetical protein
MNKNEIGDDDVTMFVVISAADNCAYGPFHTYATALAFAEDSDGSIYRCVDAVPPSDRRAA